MYYGRIYVLEEKIMIVSLMVISLEKWSGNSVGRLIIMDVVQSFLIW
jgi:hypothetical protein